MPNRINVNDHVQIAPHCVFSHKTFTPGADGRVVKIDSPENGEPIKALVWFEFPGIASWAGDISEHWFDIENLVIVPDGEKAWTNHQQALAYINARMVVAEYEKRKGAKFCSEMQIQLKPI